MFLAVKTTTSSAGLWVIVVVAVGCLALWLYMVEVFATRRGSRHGRAGTASESEARQAEATTATAVTRDDLPSVPSPRPDSDRVAADGPGAGLPEGNRAGATARDGSAARDASGLHPDAPWTPPGQRQSPTDQPAPAEPRPGRRDGGPQEPG
jgi:hypothetical protein